MTKKLEQKTRDRAIWIVRLATLGGLTGALGLTWAFSNLAEAYFSGKPPAPPAPPAVPVAAAPTQGHRQVITTVVHHPYTAYGSAGGGGTVAAGGGGGTTGGTSSGGGTAAPPPPPPPACVSTPSKPC